MKVLERSQKVFSEEELHKLRIAARLMRSSQWPGGPVSIKEMPGETFADAVQAAAKRLPPDLRSDLRDWVRWVHEYETSGALGAPAD